MESFAVSIMGRYTVHPLALIVLFAAWQTAHSCSSFLLNETFGPGCLSGRTMDFETDLGSEIGYMPKGTELKLLPLCQGAPSPKLTTKHAFAFLTSARSVVQSFHADLGVPAGDVSQVVSDGLNDQGLSVTVQWDYDVPGLPNASSCNASTAVSAMDLSTYILSSFATVEQVRKAVNPANFTVVNFYLSDSAMTTLKEAGLIAPQGYPFIHLGIHDAKHGSLVIEFVEGNTHALRENPVGVLTNEPQLPGHYRQLDSYMKSRFEVPQTAYQRFHPGTFAPVHYNSTFYAPPGDHSSQSRFIRLAMLNQVAGLRSWPEKEGWVPQGSGPSKGLWEAAENILNTIVLPPSIDDAGGAGVKNYDYTQVSILRDHVNLMYYFRSPASPQWQAVSLKESATMTGSNDGQKPLFVVVPIAHNSNQPWYTDISSDVSRAHRAAS